MRFQPVGGRHECLDAQQRLIGHDTALTRKVIVADARGAQDGVARTGQQPDGAGSEGHAHQRLQQFCDLCARETKVPMTPLLIDEYQARGEQFGQMSAHGLLGHAGDGGQFGR